MELTVKKPTTINATAIRCELPVEYDDEDMPYDFPLRTGKLWTATIDIGTGIVRDWPAGRAEELYMKVVDGGSYYLLDAAGEVLAKIEQDYVPSCVPGEYGDYVDFKIDGNGVIAGWDLRCQPDAIAESFFPDGD